MFVCTGMLTDLPSTSLSKVKLNAAESIAKMKNFEKKMKNMYLTFVFFFIFSFKLALHEA